MVGALEKELMSEPTPLEQGLAEIGPKIQEVQNLVQNVSVLGSLIRTVQDASKRVTNEFEALGLALSYDRIISAYRKVSDFIGKKYQIKVDGIKLKIDQLALEPYKNAINWIRRKVDGFRIAYKNELIELGNYALALPDKELAYV